MKKVSFLILGLLAMSFHGFSQAEVFNISDYTDHQICDGIMHDSNGGLVPYDPGSNNTITLCPLDGETQINLYFIGFNLSPGDTLYIYNGVDTSAPLIGAWSGDVMLFETVSSDNVDGCLTVNFQSNDDDLTGDFSIRISCGVPCDYPIALIEAESDTLKICPNEQFTLDAGSSSWTEGASLSSWTWDLGNLTTNTTSWPQLTHSYSQPGGYRVRLYLTDDNECSSANIPEIIVLVSTPYVFDLQSSADVVCTGTEVFVGNTQLFETQDTTFNFENQNGNSLTWTENGSVDFGDGVYIPDNSGECQYSEITFNQFPNGAVIDEESDFEFISVNMEHSFVGDITIALICPDGSVLSIWPEAGGSGTFLGEPIDFEDGVPGVGYDYSWSPNSTNGTWTDAISEFPTTIPAGDYELEPNVSWLDLEGCPLNGTWQLEICDVVGADDGWVFSFGLQFNPEFYPDILTFTPVVGEGCDSSFWELPNALEVEGDGCDWGYFTPTEPGVNTFTYTVINDFGCSYSQDIEILAVAQPVIEADDAVFCENGQILNSTITNQQTGVNYSYLWSPSTGLSNTAIQDPAMNGITEEQTYTVTVGIVGLAGCSSQDEATVLVTIPLVPTLPNPQTICGGVLPVSLEGAAQNNPNADFQWIFDDGSGPQAVGTTNSLDADQFGQYVLTVSEDLCETELEAVFFITPPPVADAGDDFYYCGSNINLDGSVESPIPDIQYVYTWTPSDPLNNGGIASPVITDDITVETEFTLTVSPLGVANCETSDVVTVLIAETPIGGDSDTLEICANALPWTLSAPVQIENNIDYTWTYFNGNEISVIGNGSSEPIDSAGLYTVTMVEPHCNYSASQNYIVDLVICNIVIPNVFTPNGGGGNDTFEILGLDRFPGSTMRIYNRWGNLVYESDSYHDEWTGADMAEGTYYYILGVNKSAGGFEYFEGHLTLLRK